MQVDFLQKVSSLEDLVVPTPVLLTPVEDLSMSGSAAADICSVQKRGSKRPVLTMLEADDLSGTSAAPPGTNAVSCL